MCLAFLHSLNWILDIEIYPGLVGILHQSMMPDPMFSNLFPLKRGMTKEECVFITVNVKIGYFF